jgi:hypothetical protein
MKGAIVERNIIYGNAGVVQIEEGVRGAPMTVAGNDVAGGYPGDGNVDQPPSFGNDRIYGQATSVQYDPQRGVSTIDTRDVSSGESVAGRVFNIGQRWGLIKAFDGAAGQIMVWGDMRTVDPADTRFEIAHTYTLRAAVAGGAGATGE